MRFSIVFLLLSIISVIKNQNATLEDIMKFLGGSNATVDDPLDPSVDDRNNTPGGNQANTRPKIIPSGELEPPTPLTSKCGSIYDLGKFVDDAYMFGTLPNYTFVISTKNKVFNLTKFPGTLGKTFRDTRTTILRMENEIFVTTLLPEKKFLTVHHLKTEPRRIIPQSTTSLAIQRERDVQQICHYSRKLQPVCIRLDHGLITVQQQVGNVEKTVTFRAPAFLHYDGYYSFVNSKNQNFLVLHSTKSWIYVLNVDGETGQHFPFIEAFQFSTEMSEFKFMNFEYVDEFGVLSRQFDTEKKVIRYIYSIFGSQTAMSSFCIHEGDVNMKLAIFVKNKKPAEPKPSHVEALRGQLGIKLRKGKAQGIFILFIFATIYLTMFAFYYLFAVKRVSMTKDLQYMEREITRLSTVIEPMVIRVNQFLKDNGKDE